jgi:signal peptidase I
MKIRKKQNIFSRVVKSIIILLVILSLVSALILLKFNSRPVQVSGTGSMYPTLPKSSEKDLLKQAKDIVGQYDFMSYPGGIMLFNKRYFSYKLGRLDIVIADNKKIRDITKKVYGSSSGVVKRVIGLPGENIELRDGLVYVNGSPLVESYTAKPHSTFGEQFLTECKKIKIPKNKYFLMGDNRKGSSDSREFGWVDEKDILLVLPFTKQKGILDKNYRDSSNDLKNSSKIKLDIDEYIKLLNEKRKEKGVQLLKRQPLLDKSAQRRGEAMLKYNDLSFEATKSAYTMYSAMKEMDYWNPYYGEFPTIGYFDSEELIENQFEYENSKKFLLDKVYQEVGISEVEGEINGCPTQIIVQHYAGYVPPDYKKENIESWKTTLNQLKQIQSGWSSLFNKNASFYNDNKADIDDINAIIKIRISNIEPIVERMDKNEWLTEQQIDYTYKDENLFKEQENIANRLNGR